LQLEGQLRLDGRETDSLGSRWRRLRDFFLSTSESGLPTVLAWDNLEQAQDSAVRAIRRLVDLHNQSQASLTTILSLNHGKLSPAVRELFEIADLGIELKALELDQTESYVRTRLETFGGGRAVFQPDAIEQLQQLTGGVPREINRLCDLALLAGMNESRTAIDRQLIASISGEDKRV
jgi:general secretion pathway protein A